MEGNKENAKQLAKLGEQAWLKAVTAPITAAISSAILTILPYILIAVVVIVLFIGIYFASVEQADEVLTTSQDIGERMGNAISLHGFRTIKEVEQDEQYKFMNMLRLYRDILGFNKYDLSLLSQTLLFEGSNEERIYLSETSDESNGINFEDPSSAVWTFIKNIVTNYQRGFLTSYAGQSQYLKANKNMFINAIALRKCKNLTGDNSSGDIIYSSVEVEQCYEGYLVAEYNYYKDWLIDSGDASIDTGVEEGYLVLVPPFDDLLDSLSYGHYLGLQQDLLRFRTNVIGTLEFFTRGIPILTAFSGFQERFYEALNIVFFGKLADADTKHFYYDGYVTQNLKEEYKVFKNEEYDDYGVAPYPGHSNEYDFDTYSKADPTIIDRIKNFFDVDVINEETKNRKETAELILDEVYYYYELAYGKNIQKESTELLPLPGSVDTSVGTSCSPIPNSDLPYFGSPTSNCNVNSCFGVYAGELMCRAHKGIDVNAPNGVYSICDGTVIEAQMYNDKSASALTVQCSINGNNYTVRYLHMPMNDVKKWKIGDFVSKGTYLGRQGNEGFYWDGNGNYRQVGTHLHLDISLNGKYVNPEVLVGHCSFSHDCDGTRDYCESAGQYYCKN